MGGLRDWDGEFIKYLIRNGWYGRTHSVLGKLLRCDAG